MRSQSAAFPIRKRAICCTQGRKHVLGIRAGATKNSTVVMELSEDIAARGVDPRQKRLFITDG